MDLRDKVARIIREEMGDCLADLEYRGPYEGEEFTVYIGLRYEPEDLEERNLRMRDRVEELGRYVAMVLDFPKEAIAA